MSVADVVFIGDTHLFVCLSVRLCVAGWRRTDGVISRSAAKPELLLLCYSVLQCIVFV